MQIISPVTNEVVASRTLLSESEALNHLSRANDAFASWKLTPIKERIRILTLFVNAFLSKKDEIAKELALLIGR